LFPKADILYAADFAWWQKRNPEFAGCKLTCSFERDERPSWVKIIPSKRGSLFSLNGAINRGRHSGFQAINIALRLTRLVVLTGFDMKGTHFFGAHKRPLRQKVNYSRWIEEMREAARVLPKDYRIINATEDSALKCFESMSLAEALNEARQAGQANINTEKDRYAGRARSTYPGLDSDRAAEVGSLLSGIGW